jgi:hypothetical protein
MTIYRCFSVLSCVVTSEVLRWASCLLVSPAGCVYKFCSGSMLGERRRSTGRDLPPFVVKFCMRNAFACLPRKLYSQNLKGIDRLENEIWDSHSGEDVDVGLLGSKAVWICGQLPNFRRKILLLSKGLKMEAIYSSETLVSINKSIRRYYPEDQHRHLEYLDVDGRIILKSVLNIYGVTIRLDSTGCG